MLVEQFDFNRCTIIIIIFLTFNVLIKFFVKKKKKNVTTLKQIKNMLNYIHNQL